jgi:alpha-tubulin suppressor-like RCC1 family protein
MLASVQASRSQALTSCILVLAFFVIQREAMSAGTVIAWGNNQFGQTTIPTGLSNVVAVSASGDFNLALRSDGIVTAWGGFNTPTNIPVGASNVTAVASGFAYGLVLRADGTVFGWGQNDVGQATGTPSAGYAAAPVTIGGQTLQGAIAISGRGSFSVALQANGAVKAWGANDFGQVSVPVGLQGVTAVSAGERHGLALKADRTVVAWGAGSTTNHNQSGQSGQSLVPPGLVNVVRVAAGSIHSLALTGDGTVVGWGRNDLGQATGTPTTTPPFVASGQVLIGGSPLTGVASIAAGGYSSVAILTNGTVVAWGWNAYGLNSPPPGLSGAVAGSVGSTHGLVLLGDNVNGIPTQMGIFNAVEVTWNAQLGSRYQIQWASALNTNLWFNYGSEIVGNGTTNSFFDTIRGRPSRFYRVIVLP